MQHDDDLAAVVERARVVVATDGTHTQVALELADRVLALHDDLSQGAPIPEAWSEAIRVRVKQYIDASKQEYLDAFHVMSWMLHQTKDGTITISQRDIEALDGADIQRYYNPNTHEFIFRLVDRKPHLTLIKEN